MKGCFAFACALVILGGSALAAEGSRRGSDGLGQMLREPQPEQGTAVAADRDPFGDLKVSPGETLQALACVNADAFRASVTGHDGSPVVTMTRDQEMFFRGVYSALPFTPPGYPVGNHIVWAVKADADEHGKTVVKGVAGFTIGDNLVCNQLPLTEALVNLLAAAGGSRSGTN